MIAKTATLRAPTRIPEKIRNKIKLPKSETISIASVDKAKLWPPSAARFQYYRLEEGLSPTEVAKKMQESITPEKAEAIKEWHYDLIAKHSKADKEVKRIIKKSSKLISEYKRILKSDNQFKKFKFKEFDAAISKLMSKFQHTDLMHAAVLITMIKPIAGLMFGSHLQSTGHPKDGAHLIRLGLRKLEKGQKSSQKYAELIADFRSIYPKRQ